jgi:predicted NAD/FAD-binding protein
MAPKKISRKKVAIIGGGSAGLAALWSLNRTPHDVYIYEAGSQLGAHTDAIEFRRSKYRAAVDTGFILNTAIHRESRSNCII